MTEPTERERSRSPRSSSRSDLYPPVEPYLSGLLDVGDGQRIYWEECGNPDGKPAVFLHGGPGGGLIPEFRRLHDPERYRLVLFDQRGCGRSTPHVSDPAADLSVNTTWHLVADIERLRTDRGIERWQVLGGSWGTALGLAYAQEYPDRVTEMVLRGVFTVRRSELDFYYNGGAGQLFPDRYAALLAPLGGRSFRGDVIAAYHDLLFDPDPAVHGPAAVAWSSWEATTATLEPIEEMIADFSRSEFALAFARIESHYFVHGAWFDDGQLIARADRLRGIPGVIVHGRYDVVTPMVTAYELHLAWPESDFRLIPVAAHGKDPAAFAELVAATDRFAARTAAEGPRE